MKKYQTTLIATSWALVAGVVASLGAGFLGLIRVSEAYDSARIFSEHPGVVVLSLMFMCSPLQRITLRSWVKVRKHLGIIFGLLALTNAGIFYASNSRFSTAEMFVAAGALATIICVPLLATSFKPVKRWMGSAKWTKLHKLSYALPLLVGIHLLTNPSLPIGMSFSVLLFAAGFRFVVYRTNWLIARPKAHLTARI